MPFIVPMKNVTHFKEFFMRPLILTASLVLTLLTAHLTAEVPPLPPEQKKELASHIVTGKVTQVFTAQEDNGKGYVNTIHLIEFSIATIEKGDKLEKGQTIYVKAWRASKRPPGWVGPSGQYEIPKAGDAVTIYMTSDKGIFNALSPNGLEIAKD